MKETRKHKEARNEGSNEARKQASKQGSTRKHKEARNEGSKQARKQTKGMKEASKDGMQESSKEAETAANQLVTGIARRNERASLKPKLFFTHFRTEHSKQNAAISLSCFIFHRNRRAECIVLEQGADTSTDRTPNWVFSISFSLRNPRAKRG